MDGLMNETQDKSAASDAPRKAETADQTDQWGAESLRKAADLVLKQKCAEIAAALARSSIKGHIQATRFLYLLAEGQNKLEAAQVVQTLHSLAIELAQEPEWSDVRKQDSADEVDSEAQTEGGEVSPAATGGQQNEV